MKKAPHEISKLEATDGSVVITLANGVTVNLSTNPGYLHLHFSGIKGRLSASAFHNQPEIPSLDLANYLDVTYTPSREGL